MGKVYLPFDLKNAGCMYCEGKPESVGICQGHSDGLYQYDRILVTDLYMALGDKLHLYSAVGRYKQVKPEGKVYYLGWLPYSFVGECFGEEGKNLWEGKVYPFGCGLHFDGAFFADLPYVPAVERSGGGKKAEMTAERLWAANQIGTYIQCHDIEAFFSWTFPYNQVLREDFGANVVEDKGFYYWAASGKQEYLCFDPPPGRMCPADFYLDGDWDRPLIVFHHRRRPWAKERNADPVELAEALQQVWKEVGGTVVQVGKKDQWYEYPGNSPGFEDTVYWDLSFWEQCGIIKQADLVVDIDSVVGNVAGELGVPLLQIEKAWPSSPNCVGGRYGCVVRKPDEKCNRDEIAEGVLGMLEATGGNNS